MSVGPWKRCFNLGENDMKKIVLASALLVAPFAFAEETAVDTATDNVAIEQQHAAYEGFYFGIGFEAAEIGHKVEYTWPTGETDVDANHSQTRVGGALVFGFWKKIPGKNFYAGIEAGINFGPTTTERSADNYAQGNDPAAGTQLTYLYDLEVKHNSFVPQLALRFGYVDCETKMMTYIKLGAAYSRVKGIYNDWTEDNNSTMTLRSSSEFKCNGITPIVALGVEKAFAKKMTGRLEAEYRFGHSKSTSGESTYLDSTQQPKTGNDSSKLIQKGTITLRAMFCYNIKI